MSKNVLFITEELFKERTGASNAIDPKQIFPMIKVASDIYIQPVLGSTLYLRLQNGITANNLSNDEKNLLNNYITDALVWYTMSMLPTTMGYQLFSKGFLQKTADESNPPSMKDLELIEQKYKSMAEFYNTRLISYLQANYSLFGEYLNTGSGVDVIFPEVKSYTCPIYLGDTYPRRTASYLNSTSSTPDLNIITYVSAGNESTFTINDLLGRTTYFCARAGFSKAITNQPTNDSQYIQINSGQVTLPTGDLTMAGEVFTFLYK